MRLEAPAGAASIVGDAGRGGGCTVADGAPSAGRGGGGTFVHTQTYIRTHLHF